MIDILGRAEARIPQWRAPLSALDDVAAIAGACALILAVRTPLHAAPSGLIVLAALTLAVRAYPLSGAGKRVAVTASTPLLAIMAVYGPAWATLVAAASVAVEGPVRARRRLDRERWLRSVAHSSLAAAGAGACFGVMGGVAGDFILPVTLPALFAAQGALAMTSWTLAALDCALDDLPADDRIRDSMLGALPALATEPVLALVLAVAATAPSAPMLLAAGLPVAGLVLALRVHADMRARLERAHASLRIQATTDALTGLANRRLFEEALAVRIQESLRYGRPLGVLLLDLDGFMPHLA